MKTVSIAQPCYLSGWPGSMSKILRSDLHVIFDTAVMPDKGYERRNYVKGTLLSVPCSNKRAPIKDVLIDNSSNWRDKHWKTIQQAYGNSSHWRRCEGSFRWMYDDAEWQTLGDMTSAWLIDSLNLLESWGEVPEVERASHLNVDHSLTGPARVVEILKAVDADRFIVGEGARSYTPVEELRSLGIETVFESYPQFQPGVSMLDVLMEYGPKSREYILGEM